MLIPVVLSGPPMHLAGTPAIEQMQRALKGLAEVRRRPAIDPGTITGVLDDTTMVALNAALGILAEELPSYVYLPLQAAFVIGGTTSYAKNFVTQYAPQITVALNTAATKYRMAHPVQLPPVEVVPMPEPGIKQLFAPGWYKQPWGIALIVIGAFGVYKLLLAKPRAVTSVAKAA